MAKSKKEENEQNEEGTILIKKGDNVVVYGTGKSTMALNKPYEVHSYVAKKLIALGAATEEKTVKKSAATDKDETK